MISTRKNTPPLASASSDSPKTPDWRETLTVDERIAILKAREHTDFWQGVPDNHPFQLLDKLVRLLDGKTPKD